jgi:hypothetical protein
MNAQKLRTYDLARVDVCDCRPSRRSVVLSLQRVDVYVDGAHRGSLFPGDRLELYVRSGRRRWQLVMPRFGGFLPSQRFHLQLQAGSNAHLTIHGNNRWPRRMSPALVFEATLFVSLAGQLSGLWCWKTCRRELELAIGSALSEIVYRFDLSGSAISRLYLVCEVRRSALLLLLAANCAVMLGSWPIGRSVLRHLCFMYGPEPNVRVVHGVRSEWRQENPRVVT